MLSHTNIEPARRNGPHESRKETLLFCELDHALSQIEALLETVDADATSLEESLIDIPTSLEVAGIVTQNRR